MLVSAFCALLVGAAACSSETQGSALPGRSTAIAEPTSVGQTTGAPSTSDGSGGGTSDLQACDLLPASARSELGISDGGDDRQIGQARACYYRVRTDSLATSYALVVAILDKQGLADIVARGEKVESKIGSHDAVQAVRGPGGCAVSLGITADSRVDAQVTGDAEQDLCAPAMAAAKLIEPQLPQS
ncbi:DUF3558 family protein [Actinokineospora bangkokensis]|uniref:DUF3558 family protein n=1 Tax=Actinokineospora bangkokensis TaxID=1193682 RepID=UPI001E62A8B9|nr:DUF3558 family protein [Actinokineospora bangkokensis]